MAEELTRKKRVRGGHKASATRMITRAEELLVLEGPPDYAKLSQESELLVLVDEGELENEIQQADLFKEGIYSTLIMLEEAGRRTGPADCTRTETPTAEASSHKVRLPKLTIKPWLVDWAPFSDSFRSSIHMNPDLSKVDKFNFLRSLSSGSALESINGLNLTGDNYDDAIELLQRCYGNKQLIINKHMDLLLNVDSVSLQHDVKGLRHLYDTIESNVRSLGVRADSYGSLLSSVLINKFPSELTLIISRKFGDSETWEVDQLLETIEDDVRARERSYTHNTHPERRLKEVPTGATLWIDSPVQKCCFCQQDHPSPNCQVVEGTESRRENLRKSGRCYVFLKKGHVARSCRSRIKCHNCEGRHHAAVCTSSKPNKSESGVLNPHAPAYDPKTTLWTYAKKHVLLQTARTTAFDPDRESESELCSTLEVSYPTSLMLPVSS